MSHVTGKKLGSRVPVNQWQLQTEPKIPSPSDDMMVVRMIIVEMVRMMQMMTEEMMVTMELVMMVMVIMS